MKTSKNIFAVILMLFALTGCNIEYFPADELSNEQVNNSPELLVNITNGTYSRLRESQYVRLRHFLQELPGDELAWCKTSGDHLSNSYTYNHLVNSTACLQFWRQAYYGIYQTNRVIEAVDDNATPDKLQLKGENLFLRALMHYDLVRIFSRPYSQSPETNLGIMIKDDTDVNNLPARSTVKETYEFIVGDLLRSAELMTESKSGVYASKEVAWALLARIYLYMEQKDKAIEYSDKVINSGKYKMVTTEKLASYYQLSPENNTETIFAVKRLSSETLGKSGIGSLYTRDGWGEIFVTRTHLNLIYENSNDERLKFIDPDFAYVNGNKVADPTEPSGYKVNKREGYSKYFNLKYTFQDGVALLASPVILRLAEMYLIKAEAFAKTPGEEANAIAMVNLIRERAGLAGNQLFTTGDLKGYNSILEVVLDERRLELAWEGHRAFDLFRNNMPLDRSFTNNEGWSGAREILPTSDRIVPFIPEDEIALNTKLIQNP